MMAMKAGEAAVRYAEKGLLVLPLNWVAGGSCSCCRKDCSSPGKHPLSALVEHGLKDASNDPSVVRQWWRRFPHANVGIATTADLWVLDVDGDQGAASLAALELKHGALRTLTSTTGRGRHLWFRSREVDVRNRAGLAQGLDVRGAGGFVVAPPSKHVSGRIYSWVEREPIALAPRWLLELVAPPVGPVPAASAHVVADGDRGRAWGRAALGRLAEEVAGTAQGGRNHAANKALFVAGTLIGAGFITRDEAASAIGAAASQAGLRGREVRLLLRVGGPLEQGAQHPSAGPRADRPDWRQYRAA